MTTALPTTDNPTTRTRRIGLEMFITTPAAAEEVLKWGFSETDYARMAELSAKTGEGTITEAEQAELEQWAHLGTTLGILQSKARRVLRQSSPA